jgi:hypothetical protein
MGWNSVSYRRLNMKTTFATKMLKHTPANGRLAIWQRGSRLLGSVGLKF